MNKYIRTGIFTLALSLFCVSCVDTLDTHPTEIFGEEIVWGSKSTIEAFINASYYPVLGGRYVGPGTSINAEMHTPNSVKCSVIHGIDTFADETGITRDADYGGLGRVAALRRCNLIIDKVENSPILTDEEKKLYSSYGHLLRGMFFYDQALYIGRILPICQVLDSNDEEAARIPMTKGPADTYPFVISDLEIAVRNLPVKNDIGKPTKWAAEVILSRACLTAYAYTKDKSYLDKAITAANDVITNSGLTLSTSKDMFNGKDPNNPEILWAYYMLKEDTTLAAVYDMIYTCATTVVIGTTAAENIINPFEKSVSTWMIHSPTQDLVDQYLVIDEETGNAVPVYESTQYQKNIENLDPSIIKTPGQIDSYVRVDGQPRRMPTPQDFLQTNQKYPVFKVYAKSKDMAVKNVSEVLYSNRDQRFYYTIGYDGAPYMGGIIGTNMRGNLSRGALESEDGGKYNTVTNYIWKKGVVEDLPEIRYSVKLDYSYNIARLAEAYLNLAEAQLLKGNIPAAVQALNATRMTHGGLPASEATTAKEAWEDYMRERNVEMVLESNDTYFSYLRWGLYGGFANCGAEPGDVIEALNRPVYKIDINQERSQFLISQVTFLNTAQRLFTTKRYMLPIAQSFLDTREAFGLDCEQNPGW